MAGYPPLLHLVLAYLTVVGFTASACMGLAVTAYALKSAAGIDLLPGPSMLHWLYEAM